MTNFSSNLKLARKVKIKKNEMRKLSGAKYTLDKVEPRSETAAKWEEGFLVFPGKDTCFLLCLFLVCSLPTKHKSQGVTHRNRNEGPSHNLLICLDGRE